MKKIMLKVSLLCLMLCAVTFGIVAANTTTASAAGNMAIHTFQSTKYTDDILYSVGLLGKPEDFPDRHTTGTYNSGIMFYGLTNSGQTSTTSSIKMDSTVFYVDFTNAKDIYTSKTTNHSYEFAIKNSAGTKVWYATQNVTSASVDNGDGTSSTVYTLNQNVNGTTTKYTGRGDLDATLIGKKSLTLSDGNYTITNVYKTKVIESKGLFNMGTYNRTVTTSGSLIVDTTTPAISAKGYSNGATITNGSYVNQRVSFTVTDSNTTYFYYKTPSMSSYSSTTAKTYTSSSEIGWHYFYVEDICLNKTATFSFYYDATAPVGQIMSNGTSIASGSYISDNFSYSANDSGIGVDRYYYKTPNTSTYQQYMSGMVISKLSGDGWYYFYSVDKCENSSAVMSVYLETSNPIVGIYRNSILSYTKTVTAAGTYETDLYFNIGDTMRITCDTSSGNVSSNYSLNTDIKLIEAAFPNSDYQIRLTNATGITSYFNIHIVRNMPKLFIDGAQVNGSTLYFNADKTITWSYDSVIQNSGSSGVSISSNGNTVVDKTILFSSGQTQFTLSTAANSVTTYSVSIADAAGNSASCTIVIDKEMPNGKIFSDGNELISGSHTNKPVYIEFTETGVTAQYSINGGEYRAYSSGTVFTADATYNVILTDRAGNKNTLTVTVNTVPPTGQLYADYTAVPNNHYTNGKVYFSWNGDSTCTVNDIPYTKNSVLIDDGEYVFVLTDRAGNSSTYIITINTVPPSYNFTQITEDKGYTITRWYLVSFEGKDYSFATKDAAMQFACQKEFDKSVTALWLNNVSDFKQTHLIAGNVSDVRVGTYWLYKSRTNPNTLLYYFDESLLYEVIAYYAEGTVSGVNYYVWNGTNNQGICDESMFDNLWTSHNGTIAPIANNFIFEQVDSVQVYAELVGGNGTKVLVQFGKTFGSQFNIDGLYKITEIDSAKNETVYYVYIDLLAPELKVTANIYGDSSSTELTINPNTLSGIAAYYYERFEIREILDSDKWMVLSILSGGTTNYYTYGDKLPTLNKGGEYVLTLYDRLGNSYTFTVFIVGNSAAISFTDNYDKTAFDIKISLEQAFDTIITLEIRRNGVLLGGVSTDKLNYTFDKAGVYTITLRDNFGRVIEQTYTFNKALPEGKLIGIENGGKTKTDVSFTFDKNKYFTIVTKNGAVVLTDFTGEILIRANDENSGVYVIKLVNINDADNFTEYGFVINTVAPVINLSGVKAKETTNTDVTVSWTDADITSAFYTLNGGEAITLTNGQALTAEGIYTVTLINDLGTETTLTFTIDKTVDYSIMVSGKAVDFLDTTNQNVAIINNENLKVSATKNGKAFEYKFGDVLLEEGVYSFRLTDDYGNVVTFTFTIDKSVSYTATVGNGVISNGDISITNDESLTITMTKDGTPFEYRFGEKLNEEGLYKAIMRDLYGNEKTIEFRIVSSEVKQSLDYTLGENVKILSVTRNGEAIEVTDNRLNFTVDGEYVITVESQNEVFTFILSLDSTPPTLELKGVANGGTTGGSVSISNPSEENVTIEVYFNGQLISYNLGAELFEYGDYRVVITDSVGNSSEYTFTLKYVMNGGAIALIVIGILGAAGIVVGIVFGKKAIYKKKQKTVREEETAATEDENEGEN